MVAKKTTTEKRSASTTKPTNSDSQVSDNVQQMQSLISELQEQVRTLTNTLAAKTTHYNRALEEAQALTHLGSWEWDISTNVITWSDELYRIYGLHPQERSIGFEEFLGLIHDDDRDRVGKIIEVSFQTGEPFEFEHRIILPSGQVRILKGMGKTIKDKNGTPLRMLGTSQDITEAKQLDQAKDEFISLVSHQLRTPLTIIRIHGNLLEDGIIGPLEPQQEHHIRTMTSASIRLIELVDDILSISRVTLNKVRVTTKPIATARIIQHCIDELTPAAQKKGARIHYQADASLDPVQLDETIFGEILRNLIGNAVRYSAPTNGHIDVQFAKEQHGYLLSVKDNGIGIPEFDQPHIFERFYRANNAIVVDSEGSGLGLYIVKLFTEAAGGRIWFDSKEAKGTTFYVSLPPKGMLANSELTEV